MAHSTHDKLHDVSELLHEAHLNEQLSRALEATRTAAERAGNVAQEARHHASPHVRHASHAAMDSLGKAASHAAELLSDTTAHGVDTITMVPLLATKAEGRRRHRVRTILFAGLAIGGIVVFFRSSLPSRLAGMFFAHDETDLETETITLPIDEEELAEHVEHVEHVEHDEHLHHDHNGLQHSHNAVTAETAED